MTDTQLYFAIGIPSLLVMLNFVGSIIAILWQARSLERNLGGRIDALKEIMNAKFEAVNSKFAVIDLKFSALEKTLDARFGEAQAGLLRVEGVLDARLKHLEER